MHSAFLDFKVLYLREYWLERSTFFDKLYNKVPIDHVPNFWAAKIFRQQAISKNKLEIQKTSGTNSRNGLASVPCAYDGCQCKWNWCKWKIILSWCPTSMKKIEILCLLEENFSRRHVFGRYHHLQGVQKLWLVWLTPWLTDNAQVDLIVPQEHLRCFLSTANFAVNAENQSFSVFLKLWRAGKSFIGFSHVVWVSWDTWEYHRSGKNEVFLSNYSEQKIVEVHFRSLVLEILSNFTGFWMVRKCNTKFVFQKVVQTLRWACIDCWGGGGVQVCRKCSRIVGKNS